VFGLDLDIGTRNVIGVVTSQVQAGDLLIRFPEGGGPLKCRNYLVLRRSFDDIYGIVGYAVLHVGVRLQPFALDGEPLSAIEPRNPRNLSPIPPLGFDFWFDAEDVLAHVLNVEYPTNPSQVTPETFNLVNRSFTRTKFSSFATACFGIPDENLETYCSECLNGYTRTLCIHCGGSLGARGSPHFRQDPVER
jgi:hypothetical protein